MNVGDHAERIRDRLQHIGQSRQETATSAKAIHESNSFIPGGFSLQNVAILLGIVGAAALIGAARFYGVPAGPDVLLQRVSTENALTTHNAAAGLAGFAGTFIASTRLSGLDAETVTLGSLMGPIILSVVGNAAAGLLFPSG